MTPRPFIPVADTFKCELRFTQHGQKVENVIYVSQHDPMTPVTMDAAAAVIALWWIADMAAYVEAGVSLNEIKMTDMSSPTAPSETFTTSLPTPGTGSAPGLPGNVTVAIKLGTRERGRSFTGRLFHVGLQNNNITGNQINPGYSAYIKNAYEQLLTALSTGTLDWVVVSFVHNKVLRTAGVATPITSISIDPNLDSQRRRLTGRGQ
jgi:hypothetical protein